MQHHAATDFWHEYLALPREIRARADQRFSLLKADPRHPSLQFKKVGERRGQEIWSARITLSYRALAIRLSPIFASPKELLNASAPAGRLLGEDRPASSF